MTIICVRLIEMSDLSNPTYRELTVFENKKLYMIFIYIKMYIKIRNYAPIPKKNVCVSIMLKYH